MTLWTRPQGRPIRSLLILFIGWKALILLVAACAPGPGYDTSASLLRTSDKSELPLALRHIVGKLIRWDAIYYVKIASRGYLFEQEWAFGWGFTGFIRLCSTVLRELGVPSYNGLEAITAICIAHISHLLSVLAVFGLTKTIFSKEDEGFAFTAASLHIISPAGIFLSAPFAESSCALLSFTGCLLFSKGLIHRAPHTAMHDTLLILSGIFFGFATTLRSNGILNGLLLLEEAVRTVLKLGQSPNLVTFRHLVATGIGGMSVGAGFLLPQYIAYSEYCSGELTRPWCQRTLPSIYTFVQDHYWNVGFLRYWTLSNVPLFLLAAPMLAILSASALWAFTFDPSRTSTNQAGTSKVDSEEHGNLQILRNLAVSQFLLVMLTATTAHVQIVTRLASAFPVWLWYVARMSMSKHMVLGQVFVRFMVIYALIQGGLFASFLPPA